MTKPEIWGRCPSCARWFPCPDWFQRDRAHPKCPRCGIEPTRIENRAPRSSATHACARQYREDLRESLGNALSYTHQLWGLSRSLTGSERLAGFAEQLGELEAVLEAELRRAELIANELERLGDRRFSDTVDPLRLPQTA
jgi:hypothetical protein